MLVSHSLLAVLLGLVFSQLNSLLSFSSWDAVSPARGSKTPWPSDALLSSFPADDCDEGLGLSLEAEEGMLLPGEGLLEDEGGFGKLDPEDEDGRLGPPEEGMPLLEEEPLGRLTGEGSPGGGVIGAQPVNNIIGKKIASRRLAYFGLALRCI